MPRTPETIPAADLALKPIAVTMGDPAGIGPDIALMAWRRRRLAKGTAFFAVGDPGVFEKRATALGDAVPVLAIAAPEEAEDCFPRGLPVLPLQEPCMPVAPGTPDPQNARATVASIERAVALAGEGRACAVVTNPIAKYILTHAGFPHPGHTEFLGALAAAQLGQPADPVMLLASPRLMVVPATVHIPLAQVPAALTLDRLTRVASITARALTADFGIEAPRIAVCGLNPHAGESGTLGREEIEVIAPAVAAVQRQGVTISGPFSADTMFHDAARSRYDVAIAMYHDQGLIPFKTLAFEDGVNVTLGLPFVRTSPDHGTAFELAGTGRANPASFLEALRLAELIARNRLRRAGAGAGAA